MKSFTCTGIIKNTENDLPSYELQSYTGEKLQTSYQKLKLMLKSNKIQVVNLILENDEIVENPNYALESMIAKIKILGKAYRSDCGHDYYVLENSITTVVYIPDDVEYLVKIPDSLMNYPSNPAFCNIECNELKVIGGSGLTSTRRMFDSCQAKSIDIKSLVTSKVTDMSEMFCNCKVARLDLSSLDTSKVTDMHYMFCNCKVTRLDLSSLDASKVTDMSYMFFRCEAQSLDFSTFDTSKVTNMGSMFEECVIEYLDLRPFNTINVTNMNYMFEGCKAQSIDISSFVTSNVTDIICMFDNCRAQVKATDRKILKKLS